MSSTEDNTKSEEQKKLESKDIGAGARFNEGKIRYDLLEPFALEQVSRIYTKGALKYAPHNWLKGMSWSKMIASLKRHLAAFEKGEDRDFDPKCEGCIAGNCTNHTGELHIAQAAWNALGLTSYYKYFPQGDDRLHVVLPKPKIGLDIDEVICDWVGPWCEKHGYPQPSSWNFSYDNKAHFDALGEEMSQFYLNLPPKIDPKTLPFEPHCYITSRGIPVEVTKQWIQKHGFPTAPVYSVGFGVSKVEVAKESGIDWFIDDNYTNFLELNRAGFACFLLTAPHNLKYNVGERRINSIQELAEKMI